MRVVFQSTPYYDEHVIVHRSLESVKTACRFIMFQGGVDNGTSVTYIYDQYTQTLESEKIVDWQEVAARVRKQTMDMIFKDYE